MPYKQKDLSSVSPDLVEILCSVFRLICCFCWSGVNWNGTNKESGMRNCYKKFVDHISSAIFCFLIVLNILVNTPFVFDFGYLRVLHIVQFFFSVCFYQHLNFLNSLYHWTDKISSPSSTTSKPKTAAHKVPVTEQSVNINPFLSGGTFEICICLQHIDR